MSNTKARTGGIELLAAALDVDRRLPAERILGAAREEAPRDVLVHALLVSCQVASVRSGVDGRMRLVVLLPASWVRKSAILKTGIRVSARIQLEQSGRTK